MGNKGSRKYAPRKPRKERSTTVTIAALSVLALATIGLSGAALYSQYDSDAPPAGEKRIGSEAAETTGVETTTPDADASSSIGDESNQRSTVGSNRLLAVSDDPERLLRAQGFACGSEAPSVEVSADGGETWTQADTSMLEISGVRQLHFGEGGRAQIAFIDQQCALQFGRSYVYGGAWEVGPGNGKIWTLGADPYGEHIIIGNTEVATPCPVANVAGREDLGIILCDDATVSTTSESGTQWTDLVEVPAAQAVAVVADEALVVTLNDEACPGVSVRSLETGKVDNRGECAELRASSGQIAAYGVAGSLFVWAGDKIIRSNDLGESWE